MKRAKRGGATGRASGFTLIELVVVVAIIGVLAAIAVPTYKEHVAKGRRAQAVAQLLQVHQYMERYYMENRTYVISAAAPVESYPDPKGYKGALVTPQSATKFSYTMTPIDSMEKDRCGTFSIDNFGQRGVDSFDTELWPNTTAGKTAARAYCWGGA